MRRTITSALSVIAIAVATLSTGSPAISLATPQAAVAGDPGRIYYEGNYTDGKAEIWSIAGDGTDARRLPTPPGSAEMPSATADGRLVMYSLYTVTTGQTIHLIEHDGTNDRKIADVDFATISPDGTKYAFLREIPATQYYPRRWAIEVRTITGDLVSATSIPKQPVYPTVPGWSGDGTQLLVAGAPDVFKIDITNESVTTLHPSTGADLGAVFSHDGAAILAYRNAGVGDSNELWLADADGKNDFPIVVGSVNSWDPFLGSFSPNDQRIAYMKLGGGANGESQIWEYDRVTGSSRKLADTPYDGVRLVWTRTAPTTPVATRTAVSTFLTEDALTTQVAVTRGVPGARITITDGTTVIRRPLLGARGTAKVNLTLPAGRHTLRASYPGTTTTKPSTSTAKTVTTY